MTEYHPSKNFKKVRLRVGEELEWDLYYTAVAYDIYTLYSIHEYGTMSRKVPRRVMTTTSKVRLGQNS